ncbi:MAG: hypothetical protein K8R37_10920 [Bacteroidales bacterium]|nr:hypothetical protein [Bacteroidales bacterium]
MNLVNERLQKSCQDALQAFQKLNKEEYAEIQSKLEWCLGSFENDKNPVGLHEFGVKSLKILKDVKVKQPRKVNKKVIDGLEKSIKSLSEN